MSVGELVSLLQALPDQTAIVVIGEDASERWLIVTGVVERRIQQINPDEAVPGHHPAVEIV
jgi:hypothetical protein